MTVLFCGGELEDFTRSGGTPVPTSSASYIRSGYSRMAINITGNSDYIAASFPRQTTVGATTRYFRGGVWTSTGRMLGFTAGGAANVRLAIVGTASTGYVRLVKYDGVTETVLATSTVSPPYNTLARVDLYVEGYGANARVRVYFDNVVFIDYTGDITIAGCTGYDGLWLANPSPLVNCAYSEVIVADEPTTRMSLVTLAPSGAGDANTMDGGNYGSIDEYPCDYSDVVWSGTADQRILVAANDLPAGTFTVRGLKLNAISAKGTAGPGSLALGLKSATTESFDLEQSLSVNYSTVSKFWSLNPVTSAPFTLAEVNAIQLGIKSRP